MKKFIGLVLFSLSVLFLSSCSKESVTEPGKETSRALGSVSFRIDKINAPSDVSIVTAYLSRPDCDTLVKNLNMYSDPASPSADISFENIKVGSWHLKIQATGSSGDVLYSGETDITIEDSRTTEVYLTLTPTPTGTGNIYISVKWGTELTWSDYLNNPIFESQDSPGKPLGGVSAAKVIFENGKYKMWYNNTYESATVDVGYAESNDGLNWTSQANEPVLKRGAAGLWDSYSVSVTSVLKDEQMYRMFYTGRNGYANLPAVGMAVSQDGIHWEKKAEPIVSLTDNETNIGATGVVKKDGIYYLYFNTTPDWRIKLATSQDGVNWYKHSENPILTATEAWEGQGIAYPSVIYDGTQFKMIYMNYNRNGFGMAHSSDGLHWTKGTGNPIFEQRNTKFQWTSQINYPFYFKNGSQYRIYYTGTANGMNNIAVAVQR
ncbi:MAG: hypothetical protein ACM3RX_08305 [Methanococcaceae archaeon]